MSAPWQALAGQPVSSTITPPLSPGLLCPYLMPCGYKWLQAIPQSPFQATCCAHHSLSSSFLPLGALTPNIPLPHCNLQFYSLCIVHSLPSHVLTLPLTLFKFPPFSLDDSCRALLSVRSPEARGFQVTHFWPINCQEKPGGFVSICVCAGWVGGSLGVSPSSPLCPVLNEIMMAKPLENLLQPRELPGCGCDARQQLNQRRQLHSSGRLLMQMQPLFESESIPKEYAPQKIFAESVSFRVFCVMMNVFHQYSATSNGESLCLTKEKQI